MSNWSACADAIYNYMINFFEEECGMSERNARKCAGNAENILNNGVRFDKDYVLMVCYAIRNAVFIGQEMQ